jgi:hypothetical protein
MSILTAASLITTDDAARALARNVAQHYLAGGVSEAELVEVMDNYLFDLGTRLTGAAQRAIWNCNGEDAAIWAMTR